MPSIWEQQSLYHAVDFCIVGAGLTGLFTSLELRQKFPKASIRVIESGLRPKGASVRNAGFACFGSPSEILEDQQIDGSKTAIQRVIRRYEGLSRIREVLGDSQIGWEANGGFEVFDVSDQARYEHCVASLDALNDQLQNALGFRPFRTCSENFGMDLQLPLIEIKGEASINTGLLMHNLIQKVLSSKIEILFGIQVDSYSVVNGGIHLETTNSPELQAGCLILATNGFTRKLVDLPVYPNRGQILLTEPIPGLKLKGNYHLNRGYYYFRNFEGGIILGGGRHLDRDKEQTDSEDTSLKIQENLEQVLSEIILPYSDYKIKRRWAGTMAFGPNNEKEPLLKQLEPEVYAAVRLGGMGVAMAPMLARDLVALI